MKANYEMMERGIPAMIFNLGGARVSVSDGENGILVDPPTVEQLALNIRRFVEDEDLRFRLHTKAKNTTCELASLEKRYKTYLDLIDL